MKLCRSRDSWVISGVCGGLAEYFGWSPFRLRVVWVLATIFTAFAGLVVYVALWFLMPKAPASFEPAVLPAWKKVG